MWFVKTRTMAAVKSNHGGEMWLVKTRTMAAVKTRTMAAITIQPWRRDVVREDTNDGGNKLQAFEIKNSVSLSLSKAV